MIAKMFFLQVLIFLSSFFTTLNAQNTYNYHYEVVKMDSTFDERADLTLETHISHLKREKNKKMGQFIGTSKEVLLSFSPVSPLSNLLVDMLFEWGNNYLISKKMNQADLALMNFGGIRAALPQGKITVGDIYQIAPFDNTVTFVFVKGSELKKMFDGFTERRNAIMANIQTTYRTGRLISYTISGAQLEEDKIYTIVTINFIAVGGDDFLSQVNFESTLHLDVLVRDIFINEIKKKTVQNIEIESKIDDRVKILPTP
jgi:2',3'-cyclic-nucleotide 2'-phosphodiesterase (5'-nucleotidase family)